MQYLKKLDIKETDEKVFIDLSENKPFSAFVFKTIADPFVGKISLFRVITGKLIMIQLLLILIRIKMKNYLIYSLKRKKSNSSK